MTNFAQPVSMQCTEEQYKRDLKDGLEKLGYEEKSFYDWDLMKHIGTNYTGNSNYISTVSEVGAMGERNRHYISHYNPSLFLAIAGMREGKDVHVGEWMIATRDSQDLRFGTFTKSTFRQKEFESQFRSPENMPSWRKATLQELINHFTKKDMGSDNTFGETNFNPQTIYTLEDLREGKVACVNDGGTDKLKEVFKHIHPNDAETVGKGLYYYSDGNMWLCTGDKIDLPTQSVKLFHSQLPKEQGIEESILQIIKEESEKVNIRNFTSTNGFEINVAERVTKLIQEIPKEHEFKFGDEVIGYNEEAGHYKVMGYYVAKSSSKTRPHVIVCDEEDLEKLVTGSYAKSTLGFNYVRRRVRVVPQPKVITSSQIKDAFDCDSYVIQD